MALVSTIIQYRFPIFLFYYKKKLTYDNIIFQMLQVKTCLINNITIKYIYKYLTNDYRNDISL